MPTIDDSFRLTAASCEDEVEGEFDKFCWSTLDVDAFDGPAVDGVLLPELDLLAGLAGFLNGCAGRCKPPPTNGSFEEFLDVRGFPDL